METDDYDVIVIGSGIGGLTTAALLSRFAGKRVAVLEAHFRLGGFTHTFTRRRWHWDVGIHYLGQLHEGTNLRRLYDVVTGGGVKWAPLPHEYDVFHYPQHTIRVPSSVREYADELARQFPDQREAIDRYFVDVRRVSRWYGRNAFSWGAPAPLRWALRAAGRREARLGLMTTQEYLAEHVSDPQLRAVLVSQWGDYGLPPSESAFGMHALLVAHYLRGGWYPAGSSRTIADGAAQVIAAGGGAALVNHRVEEILVEGGRAVGVRARVKKGRGPREVILRAPVIVSSAGVRTTVDKLLPAGVAPKLRRAAARTELGASTVTVYLGLRESGEQLGFVGENHWYFDGYDHDVLRERWPETLDGRPPMAFLSFPSLKDPEATSHTAEIITFLPSALFDQWRGRPWRRRGEEYDALKATIAQGLIDLIDRHHPGFADLVVFAEVSTPLTIEEFTGHPAGQIYGIPATPARLREGLVPPQTDLPGLLLSGADVCAPGVAGALMGGVFAAAAALGPTGYVKLMRAVRSSDPTP